MHLLEGSTSVNKFKLMAQLYWRMGTSSDSQNDEADGRSSQSQVSITTRKEHMEVDPVRGNKQPAQGLSGKEKK